MARTVAPHRPPGRRPPGPRAPALWLDLWRHRDPPETLRRLARDFPRFARVPLGSGQAYLLNHPDLITSLLVAHGRGTRKGRLLEKIRIVLGDGLLTSEGTTHAQQRRLIQPALRGERLDSYLPLMVGAAEQWADHWRDGARTDLAQQMSALTLTVVGRALFGQGMERQTAEIADCMRVLLSGAGRHLLPGADALLALPTRGNRRRLRAAERLDQLVWALVEDRRRIAAHPDGNSRDLLTVLVNTMPPQRARDEAMTLLLAGHETTATALTWAWWLLARRPDVARWWHAELDHTGELTDPARLPRTRAVFAEAMRLYPPSWLLGRRLTQPLQLDGWTLPAGVLCGASQWAMHRDGRFWSRPQTFDPGRWLRDGMFDDSAPGQPRGAYFPFGMGARACVGQGFAWAEGTLLLATLGRSWSPRPVPGHPVTPLPAITLRPRYGLPVVLARRHAGETP